MPQTISPRFWLGLWSFVLQEAGFAWNILFGARDVRQIQERQGIKRRPGVALCREECHELFGYQSGHRLEPRKRIRPLLSQAYRH